MARRDWAVGSLRTRVGAGAAAAAMTVAAAGAVAVAASAASPAPVCTAGVCTDTFGYSGAAATYTVPIGVSRVTVAAYGAAGGGGAENSPGPGGLGGEVSGTLNTSPGSLFTLTVGGVGGYHTAGTNGGGKPGGNGSGGGGASDVLPGSPGALPEFIAGGGGGSGTAALVEGRSLTDGAGGAGGQPFSGASAGSGQPGQTVPDGPQAGALPLGGGSGGGGASASGTGGNPGPGGTVGSGSTCRDGDPFPGDDGSVGASGQLSSAPSPGGTGGRSLGGGGGGGGYAGGGGGGGGASDFACATDDEPGGGGGGGGGGSSYAASSATSVSYASGVQSGTGKVVFSYPDPITVTSPVLDTVQENMTLTVSAANGLIQADSRGPAGDTLTATQSTAPTHGTSAVNPDGSFTYTPNPGYSGSDTIGFTVSDASGDYATGTVTIQINPYGEILATPQTTELNDCSASPVSGTQLGALRLGATPEQVAVASARASRLDSTCQTPAVIRAGYASPRELTTLPRATRARYANRVAWIATANVHSAVHGVHPGSTLAVARGHLKLGRAFSIGTNRWYLSRDGSVTAVLEVHHGVVRQIAIAARPLTRGSRAEQRRFLRSIS